MTTLFWILAVGAGVALIALLLKVLVESLADQDEG